MLILFVRLCLWKLLLRRPCQFDRGVIYYGVSNTYYLKNIFIETFFTKRAKKRENEK